MLITLVSVKGSPGVTSTALALAAAWPRPVILLEADPAGGDLAYRCRAAGGGPVLAQPGLLRLAAAVRAGLPERDVLGEEAQLLACGVHLVQGVTSPAQARGFGPIWSTIAQACISVDVDVIADLGRVDRRSPVMALIQASAHLLPVASATLESVKHLTEGLPDVLGEAAQHGAMVTVHPVLVGPDTKAGRDCADLDQLLHNAGLPTSATRPLPLDPKALTRLEHGEQVAGRLGRTLLIRGAREIATAMDSDRRGAVSA